MVRIEDGGRPYWVVVVESSEDRQHWRELDRCNDWYEAWRLLRVHQDRERALDGRQR